MGHTLSPLQRGLRVAVVGDGWGQGLGKSGYEAIITEADDFTYTVVSLSGPCPWTETHVLKQYCVLLDSQVSPPMLGHTRGSSSDPCTAASSGLSASNSKLVSGVRQRMLKHGCNVPSIKREAASHTSPRAAKRKWHSGS